MELKELKRPLNTYIDHTQLKPNATDKDFENLLDEAIKYNFASVCVSPHLAIPIKHALRNTGSDIRVCTVVSFPHGNVPNEIKYNEVEYFIKGGVDEIDFVINYGEFINNHIDSIRAEISTIGFICKRANVVSKAIVETCYLSLEQKSRIFSMVENSEVDFIKTSTGFGTAGATVEDVFLWRTLRTNSERPLIKAAGGIKNLKDALSLIEAGADRLGMSAGVQVMEEAAKTESYK